MSVPDWPAVLCAMPTAETDAQTDRHTHTRRAVSMMFIRLSVYLSRTGVHCDHTVHFSEDLSLWLDRPILGHPGTKACPLTPDRLFRVSRGREVGYGCAN